MIKTFFRDVDAYEQDPQIWRTHTNSTIFAGHVTGEGAVVTTENGTVIAPCGAIVDRDGKVLTFDETEGKFDGTPYGVNNHSVVIDQVKGESCGAAIDRIVQGDLLGENLWYGLDDYGDPVEYSTDVYTALKEALPRIYLEKPEEE